MNEHIKNVCRIGQGAACCRYLVAGLLGLECMKDDPADKKVVDDSWATTEHIAQGDNCEGKNASSPVFEKKQNEA